MRETPPAKKKRRSRSPSPPSGRGVPAGKPARKTPGKRTRKVPTSASPPSKPKTKVLTAVQIRKKRRQQTLAAAVIAGKKITRVAKEIGLSRSETSRQANAPETRLVMANLLQKHSRQVRKLVGMSLKAVEEAFRAGKVAMTKDGIDVDLGADHYARLTAAKRVIEVLEAARPEKGAAAEQMTITWEQFVRLYQEARQK